MRLAYYPGCSLKGTSKAYENSMQAIFRRLGIELMEIPDWNCCGATVYMSIDEPQALLMASRNIALAQKMGLDIVTPCSACYLNLLKVTKEIQEDTPLGQRICSALERSGLGIMLPKLPAIKHPLQVLTDDYGVSKIVTLVARGLKEFHLIPYYGCLLVRPLNHRDHPFFPTKMDFLLKSIGGEVVPDYSLKTKCCGGTLTGTVEEIGLRLNYLLLKEARRKGGNAMATACPLCQFNLEMYQKKIVQKYREPVGMPIYYFTQLIGLSFGIAEGELGLRSTQKIQHRPSAAGR